MDPSLRRILTTLTPPEREIYERLGGDLRGVRFVDPEWPERDMAKLLTEAARKARRRRDNAQQKRRTAEKRAAKAKRRAVRRAA